MYKSLILVSIIFLSLRILPILIEPSSVKMTQNDVIYNKPIKTDTINMPSLVIISVVSPLASIYGAYYFVEEKKPNRILNYLGFITVQIACASITENIKVLLRSPRPDFIARCKPDSKGVCTGPRRDVINSIKSFPSGHTALTFSMIGFMMFFIKNLGLNHLKKGIFSFFLIILGILMGYSRILDNRHFLKDVIGGVIVGTLCSSLISKVVSRKYII